GWWDGAAASSRCRATKGALIRAGEITWGRPTSAYSRITSAATTGMPTPATLPRVAIERSTATAVSPKLGSTTVAHANATRLSAWEGASSTPDRLISGCDPISSTPAATLLSASMLTESREKPSAVTTFPANTSDRLRERVSTVFHVPYRSSAENTSTPTRLVRTGNPHNAAKPRTTSGTANPDSLTERPNRVSSGTLLCTFIDAANANGPATHAASAMRAFSWAASLAHSTPTTATQPRRLTRLPPGHA